MCIILSTVQKQNVCKLLWTKTIYKKRFKNNKKEEKKKKKTAFVTAVSLSFIVMPPADLYY